MSFRFIIAALCLLIQIAKANPNLPAVSVVAGSIIERHLMTNGDWNLYVEVNAENQKINGWIYYDPETQIQNWIFFDSEFDETRNLQLATQFKVKHFAPNSNFLSAMPAQGSFELVKDLATEDELVIPQNSNTAKANNEQRKSDYPLIPDHKNWSSQCTNFIDQQGNINAWGTTVIQTINRYPEYLQSVVHDLPQYCPNFSKFNKQERENFWVWFVAAMAMRESSCKPNAKAKGPNGTAAGLLQLHLNKEFAYHTDCKNTHALDPHQNLSCGGAMLDRQFIRYNRIFLAKGSYWEVLQTDSSGSGVRRLVAQYRPCF
jgi:hypothetical protein